MRLLIICSIFILLSSCLSNKDLVVVPANSQYEINPTDINEFNATLSKRSAAEVDVKVLSRETEEQVKGFGLGRYGSATIFVEEENKLVLKNHSNKDVKVYTSIDKVKAKRAPEPPNAPSAPNAPATPEAKYIDFTLLNTGGKSIPLIIPTVMNPNLSPFSSSGVSLKIGQEILFKYKGKKRVLLTVTDDIKDGDELDVTKLLRMKKKELE